MKKENSEKKAQKKAVQEMRAKVLSSTNEKERKQHYTKFVLARERVRLSKQQGIDNELKTEGNDEGNQTT